MLTEGTEVLPVLFVHHKVHTDWPRVQSEPQHGGLQINNLVAYMYSAYLTGRIVSFTRCTPY